MTQPPASAVAVALQLARDLKASVLLLSHSPTKPNPLLVAQAKKLDRALRKIQSGQR